MDRIEEIFLNRKEDNRYNTSYPLNPADWSRYRVNGPLPFPDKELSLYIHIPFCKKLCSFCEYTRTVCPEDRIQIDYVRSLRRDILQWLSTHPGLLIRGFDIGGGTPTALCDEAFQDLMELFSEVKAAVQVSADFEPSIEGTFQTITDEKLEMIAAAGIRRLSLGIQSTNKDVLKNGGRSNAGLGETLLKREKINDSGIKKLNIDLMYGLRGQSLENLSIDIDWIRWMAPEQVTVYEYRPNMISGLPEADKETLYRQYEALYEGFSSLGYTARFGANTFTKEPIDRGVSSYLRSRMKEGVPYKGFGLSAQSMSSEGVSYNLGKGRKNLSDILSSESFPEEFTYVTPPVELMSKYIAIGAYSGEFSIRRASELLGEDFRKRYSEELLWCLNKGYLEEAGDWIRITRQGFKFYGAVFSLFQNI